AWLSWERRLPSLGGPALGICSSGCRLYLWPFTALADSAFSWNCWPARPAGPARAHVPLSVGSPHELAIRDLAVCATSPTADGEHAALQRLDRGCGRLLSGDGIRGPGGPRLVGSVSIPGCRQYHDSPRSCRPGGSPRDLFCVGLGGRPA